jgi:hypothetical protein
MIKNQVWKNPGSARNLLDKAIIHSLPGGLDLVRLVRGDDGH